MTFEFIRLRAVYPVSSFFATSLSDFSLCDGPVRALGAKLIVVTEARTSNYDSVYKISDKFSGCRQECQGRFLGNDGRSE